MEKTLYDFTARRLDGTDDSLDTYRGKVALIVNVASRCGFTPQYEGLQTLWDRYRDRGLVVLGFPCNQFGAQEPGSDAEIGIFCSTTYDVDFPMFSRIEVNGDGAHPLYAWLKSARPGLLGTEAIKWNFTKFLIGRDGLPLMRYAPTTKPAEMASDIEAALG